jgi:hypothetical protein
MPPSLCIKIPAAQPARQAMQLGSWDSLAGWPTGKLDSRDRVRGTAAYGSLSTVNGFGWVRRGVAAKTARLAHLITR